MTTSSAPKTVVSAHYFTDVTETIGGTPLVPLRRMGEGLAATVLDRVQASSVKRS